MSSPVRQPHAIRIPSRFARSAIIAAGPGTALDNMTVERHRPIVDHIRDGDAEAARAYLDDHMASAARHVVERLRR